MKFLFYHIGSYGQVIQDMVVSYFTAIGMAGDFYFITENSDPILEDHGSDASYFVFFLLAFPHGFCEIHKYILKKHIHAKIIALCSDDQEGIKALGYGSDYALRLPLKKNKIIQCLEHLKTI